MGVKSFLYTCGPTQEDDIEQTRAQPLLALLGRLGGLDLLGPTEL